MKCLKQLQDDNTDNVMKGIGGSQSPVMVAWLRQIMEEESLYQEIDQLSWVG